jgi:protein TonB
MMTRKFLILFVLASLAGHALVLALTTRIDWTIDPRPDKVITVELKAPRESAPRKVKPPLQGTSQATTATTAQDGIALTEDSVSLQSRGSRYDDYLLAIRRKIERLWSYPQEALAERREGNAVIRFTIEADGTLAGYHVMATSGSPVLDEGALAVIRSAAPYEPLPGKFSLSRLNITATFTYRLNP